MQWARAVLPLTVTTVLWLTGCPKPPAANKQPAPDRGPSAKAADEAPPPAPEAAAPKSPAPEPKPSAQPIEASRELKAPLRTARAADLPVLEPILEYVTSSGSDLKDLAGVPWMWWQDTKTEDPQSLPEDTVIYRIGTEKHQPIVLFGPPASEWGLKFRMKRVAAGQWRCLGHDELSGLELFDEPDLPVSKY